MTKHDVVLGMDIGGTNTAFGLVDRGGVIHERAGIPTLSHEPPEQFFRRLFDKCRELLSAGDNGSRYELKGIGIGAPNGNYYRGTVEHPPNLGWGLVKVVEIVKTYYPLPAVVTNDANAAALGEMMFGAAKDMKHFVEITLGTGLGSGIVVNGQVLYGHDGFAGEIGHVNVEPGGRLCGCGNKGCLEAYVSATGIVRTVTELLAQTGKPNAMRDVSIDELTSKLIYREAKQGNEVALAAFEVTGQTLGRALADTAAHLNPEAVVLFGGLAQAGELLFKPVREYLETHLFPIFRNKIKVIPSALPPGDAAILGASALIWGGAPTL
jgi:glucokinase